MAYIGRGINSGDAVSDHLTGSGATVYTLTYDTTTDGVVLSLDGVVQRNGTDFTILGTQLTFTSAVASPIAIQIIYTGLTLAIGTPGTGTVGNAQMADDAIGIAELSSTGTASSSTYLRGDNSWATIPATADEITKSSSDPTVSTNPAGGVGTVFLNTTSGEMFSCTDATAGANVWVNIGEGTGSIPVTYTSATGGTITTDGSFKVHTFTTSGTFTPTLGSFSSAVEYLVIAGGGGGGGYNNSAAGGGGAGGYRTATNFTVTDTGLTVTVGGGGAGGDVSSSPGTVGANSVFDSITSLGGSFGSGGGASYISPTGGSGGGGCEVTAASAGTAGQGYAGGAGSGSGSPYNGGGGGGASAVGGNSGNNFGGTGGAGTASSITGSAVTRAGGGGGDSNSGTLGVGGSGGGGNGARLSATQATAGTVNLGGGGGGGITTAYPGQQGGSGVVIIRYQFQA